MAALSPPSPDGTAEQGGAEGEEAGGGVFLTSMGSEAAAPALTPPAAATAGRKAAQRKGGPLAMSTSLPELTAATRANPRGGAFSKAPRLPPSPNNANGPGPGAYNLPAQGTGKTRRVRGVLAFGPARPQGQGGGVGPEVLHLLQQQNAKITTALSRMDALEQRLAAMAVAKAEANASAEAKAKAEAEAAAAEAAVTAAAAAAAAVTRQQQHVPEPEEPEEPEEQGGEANYEEDGFEPE